MDSFAVQTSHLETRSPAEGQRISSREDGDGFASELKRVLVERRAEPPEPDEVESARGDARTEEEEPKAVATVQLSLQDILLSASFLSGEEGVVADASLDTRQVPLQPAAPSPIAPMTTPHAIPGEPQKPSLSDIAAPHSVPGLEAVDEESLNVRKLATYLNESIGREAQATPAESAPSTSTEAAEAFSKTEDSSTPQADIKGFSESSEHEHQGQELNPRSETDDARTSRSSSPFDVIDIPESSADGE
ncbi:MAG: hypothetical protein HC923_01515 [Myxococcales bacterium]|nr:hypothetical protein [Myxococcales bacterium]